MRMSGTVLAGALGNCVHVAGVAGFLRVAEETGYKTEFLGAAVSVDRFVAAIRKHDPEIVGISYRLTPEVGLRLIEELKEKLGQEGLLDRRFVFGGTPPMCEAAAKLNWFERCFSGLEDLSEVWKYFRGGSAIIEEESLGDNLIDRIANKRPYPVLRHHFGLPSFDETLAGVKEIAEAGALDVISIAPDQNAQESFFRPGEMNPALDGAGGVPVRTAEELRKIREASRCGNYPLLRIYSGTRDLIKWAELSAETINNAWAAVPLCWYSTLDGRSNRPVAEAIAENQACMRWHGERGIPLEVNEPHHWSLRDAHDTISVVMAYLAAYNAKAMGVERYIAQYMFNSPPGSSFSLDLAKILAQMEMVEGLHNKNFVSYRQTRAGLLHLSPHLDVAKGQLASSTMLALAVKPHIIHVVGFCEGDHAASPADVIESCRIVQGVLKNCMFGLPDMASDPTVQRRKSELIQDAKTVLQAISGLKETDEDPFTSPGVLAKAIKLGILDAPHLKGNPEAAGRLQTRIINGAVYPVDPNTGKVVSEADRLAGITESRISRKAEV